MKMRMRTKRRRNRTGISLILGLILLAAVFPVGVSAESYAMIVGNVFSESGYALPGADATLVPDAAKGGNKMRTFSNSRGEFVFRAPPGPLHYTLKVAAKGFQSQEKAIQIQDDERVDVTFQLQAQSK
jgi:hypothetical protein